MYFCYNIILQSWEYYCNSDIDTLILIQRFFAGRWRSVGKEVRTFCFTCDCTLWRRNSECVRRRYDSGGSIFLVGRSKDWFLYWKGKLSRPLYVIMDTKKKNQVRFYFQTWKTFYIFFRWHRLCFSNIFLRSKNISWPYFYQIVTRIKKLVIIF